MSVRIEYGGFALGAKTDFTASSDDTTYFSDFSDWNLESANYPNFANAIEPCGILLDGSALPIDDSTADSIGWWSESVSDDSGAFSTPPTVSIVADRNYASAGITLVFDAYNGVYATDLTIKWYRGNDLLAEANFQPDSAYYYCEKKVESYNKLVISFAAINAPQTRLKVRTIEYGRNVVFFGDELRNVKVIQQLDPLSSELAINTCDFEIYSKRNADFAFTERQPVNIYFNDVLYSANFVSSSVRSGKNIYKVQTEDYIGVLDKTTYYGDLYTGANARLLIDDILKHAKVPYEITGLPGNKQIFGHLPIGTCRSALTQIAFALGLVVDTSNSDKIRIFTLGNEVSQEIPLSRIMQGQKINDSATVTAVELTSHAYRKITEEKQLYSADESGTGTEIIVTFSEPMHDLSITNGTITEYNANYAKITANSGCVLEGQRYEHTQIVKRKDNPAVLSSDAPNIVAITDATLIYSGNIDNTLERCYNYLSKNRIGTMKIVERATLQKKAIYGSAKYGKVKYGEGYAPVRSADGADGIIFVGDRIAYDTEYLGMLEGTIIEQTYNLNGGVILKNVKVR